MGNQWFRLYHEFATDTKVQMMPEAFQRRLIMLMCISCCNGNETFHDDEVVFQLRISNDEWQQTKRVFIEKGFIDNTGKLRNWNKRQFISDSSTERVRKHREAKKQECNVSVTPPETETDTETDTEKISTLAGTCDDKPSPCPHNDIISAYNKILPELPHCKTFSEQYRKMLRTRWREDPERQSVEWWENFFKNEIKASDFLMGRVKDFQADLTWIVRPMNFTKIVNGKYRNKTNDNRFS